MATLYNSIIRQILLRGNFFAGDQSTMAASYDDGLYNDSAISDSGAEYSFLALTDAILQAMGMIVEAIGENRNSEHRAWFITDSDPILDGGALPIIDQAGSARYGAIADIRDASDGKPLSFQPRAAVEIARQPYARFKVPVYHFFTDDRQIWHTRTSVIARMVAWNRNWERQKIEANDTNTCSLPDGLLPVLEKGALSFVFKDTFNTEQAQIHWQQFVPELNKIAGRPMAALEMNPKI